MSARPSVVRGAVLALAALLGTVRPGRAVTGDELCDVVKSTFDTCVIVGLVPPLVGDTMLTFGRPNLEVRGTLTVGFVGACSVDPGLACVADADCGPAPAACERTGRITLQVAGTLTVPSTGVVRAHGHAVTGDRMGPNGGTIALIAQNVTVGGVLDASAAGTSGGVPGGRGGEIVLHADGAAKVETGARLDASSSGGCGGAVTIDGPSSLMAGGNLLVEGASFGGTIQLLASDYISVPGDLGASNTGTLTTRPPCPVGLGGGQIQVQAKRVMVTGTAKAEGRQAPGGRVRLEGERGVTVDSTVGAAPISVTGGDRDGFFAGGGVFVVAGAGDVDLRQGRIEANGVSTDFGSDAGVFQIKATGALRCDDDDSPCAGDTDCADGASCVEVGGNVVVEAALSAIGESGAGFGCFFDDGVRTYTCEISGTGDVTVSAPVNVGGGRRAPAVGGKLIVRAGRNLTVGPGPIASSAADGGDIVLVAGERAGAERGIDGVLHVVDGTVVRADARGEGGFGGRVELEGCTIELSPTVSVDVDAMTGGHSDGVEVTARNRLSIDALAAFSAEPDGTITLAYRGTADVSPDAVFQPPATLLQDPTIPACPACGNELVETPEECDGHGTCAAASQVCQPPSTPSGCTCRDTCGVEPGIQPGEDCDGTDFGGLTCEGLGFPGGVLACRPDCTLDTSGCTPDRCGDGIVGATETCDPGGIDGAPPSFGDATCATLGFPAGGTLACTPDCATIVATPHCGATVAQACTTSAACPATETCDAGCVHCGNGFLDAGEECDEGTANGNAPDHCRVDCRLPRCGDATVDAREQCDAGGAMCVGGANASAPCCADADCPGGTCGGAGCSANRDDRPTCCRCDCTVAAPACATCDDENPCTADSCDPVTGCHFVPVADGTPCADADRCNGEETCRAGACAPGTPLRCDDADSCTADVCVGATGCRHERYGYLAASNAVEASQFVEGCVGVSVPPAVGRLLRRARVLIASAEGAAAPRKAARFVRRAIRKMQLALTRVEKAERRGLAAACATPLAGIVSDALARARCILGPP